MNIQWKKIAYSVVATSVILTSLSPAALAQEGEKAKQGKQLEKLSKISVNSKGKEKVSWDEETKVPSYVKGKISSEKLKNKEDALEVMEENKELYLMDSASSELKLLEESKDDLGFSKYKYQQQYKGVPVYGRELIIHADKEGKASSIIGKFDPEVKEKKPKTKAKFSAKEAIAKAKKTIGFEKKTKFSIEKSDKVIYQDDKGKYHLAYIVTLSTLEGKNPGYYDVVVSARTLDVIHQVNKSNHAAETGTGVGVNGDRKSLNTYSSSGTYYLYDTTKPMYSSNNGVIKTYTANQGSNLPGSYVTDSDNYWTDGAAVDAHNYAGKVYDYYYQKHGRNSFDGNGGSLISTVHYYSSEACPNNAFWDGTQMAYCDGDGSQSKDLSGALDVVGHEITHAVTERTAGLIYQNQSGALNESWSDVLGNLIENKSDERWLVGEDVWTPNIANDGLRSMSNPESNGYPSHMNDYRNLPNTRAGDWGGVHINSSIPNKAFYNFVTSSGVTRDEAGKVWYRALTQYLTSSSEFMDARNATIQASTDLYGASAQETIALTNAWAAVGLGSQFAGGDDNQSEGDAYEANNTLATAYGPITSGKTYKAQIGSSTDQDWFSFTTGGKGTISIDLGNLPADYDLYLYNASGTELKSSENGNTSAESISYSNAAAGKYYVLVVGYNGAKSSQSYELRATYPGSSSEESAQWYYEEKSFSSPHPYANNSNTKVSYSKAGAQKVALHFSKFDTEARYDVVKILDGSGKVIETHDGEKEGFWAIVDSDKITANLVTDSSVTKYGYDIDQVAYYASKQLVSSSKSESKTPVR
ncbi:M4 family metallopeptidase [Mechercharimyces sp. CAU 1602]|uniref:M4 family metallopeptidase n=1 Tax=Mechercharimyces sp. CAU 1602 TaxID=2973933 RepID=UPI0021614254|nr:M4 family metallopeptidase [Mechercharimyces sp. CAU 1602]MCS1351320.1 M4 family metallopeptidase [Mechercharimyces sp. CAU 1602]